MCLQAALLSSTAQATRCVVVQVFDLLMAEDCTRGGDYSPALRELLLTHAAPECSGMFSASEFQHRLQLIKAGDSA